MQSKPETAKDANEEILDTDSWDSHSGELNAKGMDFGNQLCKSISLPNCYFLIINFIWRFAIGFVETRYLKYC